jgi:hypothetical protein
MVKLTDTVYGDGRKTRATHDHDFVARQLETFPGMEGKPGLLMTMFL